MTKLFDAKWNNRRETENDIELLIKAYNNLVGGIEEKATKDQERAYGGIIRAGKGKLVEQIGERIVKCAWRSVGGAAGRLEINGGTVRIPINKNYLERIKNETVRQYISENIPNHFYRLRTDIRVNIDKNFVLGVECKSYTENAMLKRILVDFTLLQMKYPHLDCVLLQLESQLGGDYSELNPVTFGSPSTQTLISYFDVDLHIITLLKGERKVDRPIHKKEYFKILTKESLYGAVDYLCSLLKKHIRVKS